MTDHSKTHEKTGQGGAGKDTATLFTSALNVINAALAKHGDDAPYEQMLAASEKLLGDRRLGVAVYAEDASAPFDYYTIRFRDRRFELVEHGKQEPEATWKVSRDYLAQVAESPQEYIEHPAKLDWDWLKSRLGL